MSSHLPQDATPPPALSAFLRGIERRGALFAELQCGDRDAGDTALSAAMRAFRNHAARLPMADWPRRFWTLLVAAPQLRAATPTAHWSADVRALSLLEPTHRQALLLRLAASLPEDKAAAVLALDTATYEQALAAACPRDAEGQPDAVAWRTLAEAVQLRLRDLPPERLARLARLREAALHGTPLPRPITRPPAGANPPVPAKRRWPWVLLVLALCAAALAATWWWPQSWRAPQALPEDVETGVELVLPDPDIDSEALPEQTPAARFNAVQGLLTHRDFELVMEPEEEAIARDADFLAWYASGASELPPTEAEGAPPDAPVVAEGRETTDAEL
jgi:hypothetical protein